MLAKKCGLLFTSKAMVSKTFVVLGKKSLSLSKLENCGKLLSKLKYTIFLL